MKKNQLYKIFFVLSILVLPALLILSPVTTEAAKKADPVPMDLDGTEWEVEMTSVSAKGKRDVSTDKLIFKNKKFISQNYQDKGYDPTNYSLRLEDDGVVTRFGTMQIEGKETSFWKGKVKDDKIDGSVHVQLSGGSTKTTYFSGTLTSGVLKPKVKTKPKLPPPPPPAPKVEPKAPVKPVVEKVKEEVKDPVDSKVEENEPKKDQPRDDVADESKNEPEAEAETKAAEKITEKTK